MIFLYIYIGISLLTFIMLLLETCIVVKAISKELKLKEANSMILPPFFQTLKLFIISFIPLFNIIVLCVILFCGNQLEETIKNNVKQQLEEGAKHE